MTLPPTPARADLAAVFPGGGEMAARCRAFDWAATPLGAVDAWSHALRTTAGIVLGSQNPMFLFWGPEAVQLYNDAYRPSLGGGDRHPRALGARAREFWTDIWEAIGPQIAQVMATGEPTWYEDQYLPIERNGRLDDVWWTYSYSAVYDDDGTIGGVLVVCQETTRRVLGAREREQLLAELEVERARLRETFRQSPSFLAVLRGPDNVFELVNDAYEQIIGRGRDVVGKPLFEAIPETRGQGFDGYLGQVRATGEPLVFRDLPVQLDRTPGAPREERFIDITYLPLVESDGTHEAVIAHGSDVTEQVLARRAAERLVAESERARAEAEAARAEAEGANRAKAEFLAVMSHELRTPLNAIGGYAELIELGIRGPVTAEQRADLARLQRSQRHLLGLINGVLNYARIEAGAVHYDLADVPLDEVLGACEALVAPQVRAKGLAFTHGQCAPLCVRADREKLQQVVLNLLSNAVKFTEAGGEVVLRCAADGDRVRVEVRDTGIGIAAEQMARVFEPFVQVDARLTRAHEGTGLGLAISRDLARGMGGELTAESTPRVGSTFALTLPAAR